MDGSTPWEIPAGALAVIRYSKPDGTVGFYDTLENGDLAYSFSGNIITFGLATQALTVPGTVYMQIDFYAEGNVKLSTFTFRLEVQANVFPDEEIISDDYIDVLTGKLSEAAEIFEQIKAAYGAPRIAATVAAMTDHSLIYVYTGSETAYVAGNWYYWDGTAWTSGGVYNSNTTIDATLSIQGDAADAKAAGNAISYVRNNLTNKITALSSENLLLNIKTEYKPRIMKNGFAETESANYDAFILPVETGVTYYINGHLRIIAKYGANIQDFTGASTTYAYTYTSDFTGDLYITFFRAYRKYAVALINDFSNVGYLESPYFYKDNLQQTKGDSQHDVMSQKAVTDIVNETWNSIDYLSGSNLFDKTSATSGKRFDGAGDIVDDASCFVSDFIPVTEGITYIKNGPEDTFHKIVYTIFDISGGGENNTLLVSTNNETEAPEHACFVRFSGLLSEINDTTLLAKTADDIIARERADITEITVNLFNKIDSVDGYIDRNGDINENPSYKTSDYIKVFAGQKIVISPTLRKFLAFNYYKAVLSNTFVDAKTDNYVFEPTADGYIRFTYYLNQENSVQVNKGEAVQPYEPYGYKLKENIYVKTESTDLKGKSIYSFGDSLLYGHYSGIGAIDGLADDENLSYTKYAVNGASILGGGIETQVNNASETVPDFIVFDGLMNDASNPSAYGSNLGSISSTYTGTELDTTTFYGAFEHLIYALRTKYMTSNILFICCHKTPSRTAQAQETLQEAVRKCCEKWAIPYVDIYNGGQINCYIDSMRNIYSYDNQGDIGGGNGTHLTGEGYNKWYAPQIKAKMLELLEAN
jgi:hypothetical protein